MEDDQQLRARVERLAAAERPGTALTGFDPLQGGHSSRTYLPRPSDADRDSFVVKVAPAGVPPTRNRDVLRQARALDAVRGVAGLAVPTVFFRDEGAPVEVPPLFAMSFVTGECVEPALDEVSEASLPAPDHVRSRALEASRMLRALHSLDPASIGLGDEPETSLEQEIERWDQLLSTIDDRDLIAGADDVAAWLRKTTPPSVPARLLHGDFRLGNTLCDGDRVRSVIDWEIWSVGDPRTDLAWFLLTVQPHRHPSALRQDVGFPAVGEVVEAYGGEVGAELDWFQCLQLYKMASATALIAKNMTRRGGDDAMLSRVRTSVPVMIERAAEFMI